MALLRLIITAAVGWCCATSAPAEEPHAGAVPIRFVPATGSGTVSLGVYDREGLLVRVLCDEWPFSRFRVGLNGLSTTWDGKDNDGQAVPEGIYTARGDRLALLGNESLRFFLLPDFASQGEEKNLPAPLVSIALLDQGAIASAEDGSVWRWQAGWSPVEMPPGTKVRAVSAGRDNTFWVLEENADGSTSAAHYSPDEGRLAEWSPGADEGKITEVAGTTEKDYFVASLTAPDTRRTVGIRRKSEGEGWEYVFDKKITRSAEFGWKDGQLSATGGETPQEIAARLIVNPLDPGASRDLVLRAATNAAGPVLQTGDGLPLLRISSGAGYHRVMVVAGPNENTARFFQGDGSCVEEYALSGLGNMTSFDAGTIKMTGGAEATPPVVEEPQPAAP